MSNIRKVTEDIYWLGVNDEGLELFEEFIPIPEGVVYNSYLLVDEKTVLFDTADIRVVDEFLASIKAALDGRTLDYLVVQHMEPDHSCCIQHILETYPDVTIIGNEKTFLLARQFGVEIENESIQEVVDGESMTFGKHTVVFTFAPMVHWPEVMMSFDVTEGVLFSADAFGSFGKLVDGKLFSDEVDYETDWIEPARRYFTNIVGKYGSHVQHLLKKIEAFEVKMILPLHGLIWRENLGYFLDKYDKWSRYEPEEKGVLIVYASMYGNTEKAAQSFSELLKAKGVEQVATYNVSNTDASYLVSETFRLSHVVIACPTYNLGIFPLMHNYFLRLKELNVKNRTIGIIENGSWAPKAGDIIHDYFDKELKEMTVLDDRVTIISAMKEMNDPEIESLIDALVESLQTS
ncbi:MAG: FprA family A-type flavoprotein [Defluviitaleaceae bacterium]|nr:FprA family A-type flavoprotein [Defluviitaleaceae bacterium]